MIKVLLVDDNKIEREAIFEFIEWDEMGAAVAGQAQNGEEGYRMALSLSPDIVITDMDMPVMDGVEMTEKIKEKKPEIKFIFISCFEYVEYLKSAISLQVRSYITKPIDFEKMQQTISEVVNAIKEERSRKAFEQELVHKLIDKKKNIGDSFTEEMLYGMVGSMENCALKDLYKEAESLILGDSNEEIWQFAQRYFGDGAEGDENYKRMLLFSVVNFIQLILSEHGMTLQEVIGDDITVWQKTISYNTIANVRMWVYNFISLIRDYLKKSRGSRYDNIVGGIIRQIDEHYAELKNAEEIAQKSFISASYANSLFKASTGRTIFDYLTEKRLEAAKELLRDGRNKVYEVAEKVGYSSPTYFGIVFKKAFGMSPKEYQNKHLMGGN